MTDLLNLVMLVCAATGAMAFGILLAYWMLRAGFALISPNRRRAERPAVPLKAKPQIARML